MQSFTGITVGCRENARGILAASTREMRTPKRAGAAFGFSRVDIKKSFCGEDKG